MPVPRNREVHDYAERIRKRIPSRFRQVLKTAKMNPYQFEKESGVKTDAKAEVWSDAAGFAAASNKFQVEASRLQLLAIAGDLPGMKGQARAVGGSCKGCHDKYRVPEKK